MFCFANLRSISQTDLLWQFVFLKSCSQSFVRWDGQRHENRVWLPPAGRSGLHSVNGEGGTFTHVYTHSSTSMSTYQCASVTPLCCTLSASWVCFPHGLHDAHRGGEERESISHQQQDHINKHKHIWLRGHSSREAVFSVTITRDV